MDDRYGTDASADARDEFPAGDAHRGRRDRELTHLRSFCILPRSGEDRLSKEGRR
jgi:hypothetical protein